MKKIGKPKVIKNNNIKSIRVSFMHPTDGRIISVNLDNDITPEEIISALIDNNFINTSL